MILLLLSTLALASLDQFTLIFSKKDIKHFDQTIQLSLKRGYLIQDSNLWRRSQLKSATKTYDISAKLKGDLPKHWKSSNKSWNIKFKSTSPFDSTRVSFSLAADKYFSAPLLIYELKALLNMPSPKVSLIELTTSYYQAKGLLLVEEDYSEGFREKTKMSPGDFYRPNNQWVITLESRQHPYATSFLNPKPNHPLLGHCVFFRPTLKEYISEDFCDFLKLTQQNPREAIERYLDKETFLGWMALMTYLSDVHSTLPDNHSWYMNFITGQLTVLPNDFIPAYPLFKSLEAYLKDLSLRHPLFKYILHDEKLKEQYESKLEMLMTRSKNDRDFLLTKTPLYLLNPEEKTEWLATLHHLSSWHLTLEEYFKKKKN